MAYHPPTPEQAAHSSRARPAGALRTLVVDSSAEFLNMLSAFLWSQGLFRVVSTAREVHDALAKAAVWQPDLALITIQMPLMGGLDATPHLLHAVPGVRVILMSSLDLPAIRDDLVGLVRHVFYLDSTAQDGAAA